MMGPRYFHSLSLPLSTKKSKSKKQAASHNAPLFLCLSLSHTHSHSHSRFLWPFRPSLFLRVVHYMTNSHYWHHWVHSQSKSTNQSVNQPGVAILILHISRYLAFSVHSRFSSALFAPTTKLISEVPKEEPLPTFLLFLLTLFAL